MANALSSIFICSKCDTQYPKWAGRCSECGSWGTLVEQTLEKEELAKNIVKITPSKLTSFDDISNEKLKRFSVGLEEVNRVLGGGLVPGSFVLLGGEPGIGKSTLVAQLAGALGKDHKVVYVSGEESANQIKNRLERLKIDLKSIRFLNETNVEKIVATLVDHKPDLVIIDSIQTVYSAQVLSEAGGVSQIRASAVKFLELAKQNNIAVIIIGHITKDGGLAGPKSLEHIVDTVLYLEVENNHNFRILRTTKNRFGSVNEIGVLDMLETGFIEVNNPSGIFLEETEGNLSGSVISAIIEGTRPFLVEVQALVSKTVFGYPQRKTSGFDLNRLQVLAAVLTKRAKLNLNNQDIILNLVGGMKLAEPALDLAVCFAIVSSLSNQSLDNKTLVLGEVGLGGEIRNVARLEHRLNEAAKLGFTHAIVPTNSLKLKNIKLSPIKNLAEIVNFLAR